MGGARTWTYSPCSIICLQIPVWLPSESSAANSPATHWIIESAAALRNTAQFPNPSSDPAPPRPAHTHRFIQIIFFTTNSSLRLSFVPKPDIHGTFIHIRWESPPVADFWTEVDIRLSDMFSIILILNLNDRSVNNSETIRKELFWQS